MSCDCEATIKITQGNNPVITLTCGVPPINLTGATFQTIIPGPNGTFVTIPNGQHTILIQSGATLGQIQVALTEANTSAMLAAENMEIITNVTIGSALQTFRGYGILTVRPALPSLGIPQL